jgi:hypothetical protein
MLRTEKLTQPDRFKKTGFSTLKNNETMAKVMSQTKKTFKGQ